MVLTFWKRMENDWKPLLEAYQKHCNPKATGQTLVRALRDATERSKPDDLKISVPHVQAFTVQLHKNLPEVRVLATGGGLDRRALPLSNDQPEELTKTALLLAKSVRSSSARLQPTPGTRYDARLHMLWKARKQDIVLQQVLAAWKAGEGVGEGGDYRVLMYLQGHVDRAQGEHPDKDHPEISLFRLSIPGIHGEIALLCRLREDGTFEDLRGVPPDKEVSYVLHELNDGCRRRQYILSRRQPQTGHGPRRHVRLIRKILADLSAEFEAFSEHHKKNPQIKPSGRAFLRHLDELCDKAEPSIVVDKENDIHRYEVKPDGCTHRVSLLRRYDERGLLALRVMARDADE
ncbi:MAG TPA: hypothetical protein VFP68_05940, partial [Burkholderiaceae bacterium]|nr:hypothetical protein [Burkholderiaceae bacterium]